MFDGPASFDACQFFAVAGDDVNAAGIGGEGEVTSGRGDGEAGDSAGCSGFPFGFEVGVNQQEAGVISDGGCGIVTVGSGEESESGEGP